MYTYIPIYVYIYIYMYVYVYIYIYICIYIYMVPILYIWIPYKQSYHGSYAGRSWTRLHGEGKGSGQFRGQDLGLGISSGSTVQNFTNSP